MRHILAPENRAELARMVRAPILCAFDFDGTLAPFTADPDATQMRPSTRALLEELACVRPCAVISGRARRDVAARVAGAELIEVVGNHGIEPHASSARFAEVIARAHGTLTPLLDAVAGVTIEAKVYGLAIHFRHAPDHDEARAAIRDALSQVRGVRLVGGELVVNIVPADAPNKGDALLMLVVRTTLGGAIFVGDDETDEDAFALRGTTGPPSTSGAVDLLTVRVGYSNSTKAAYFLEHQEEVDLLLQALVHESGRTH